MANNFMMISPRTWIKYKESDEELFRPIIEKSRSPTFGQVKEIIEELGLDIRKEEREEEPEKIRFRLELYDENSKDFLFEISAYPKAEQEELEVLFFGKHHQSPIAQLLFVYEIVKRYGSQVFFCTSGDVILVQPDIEFENLVKEFEVKFKYMFDWHEQVMKSFRGS